MLTGAPPFRGASSAETLAQVIAGKLVPPSQLRPDVPGALERVCMKCLAHEPEQRYATAAALADDLRRLLDRRSAEKAPPGLPARLWSSLTRARDGGESSAPASEALLHTVLDGLGDGVVLVQPEKPPVVTAAVRAVLGPGGVDPEQPGPLAQALAAPDGAVEEFV